MSWLKPFGQEPLDVADHAIYVFPFVLVELTVGCSITYVQPCLDHAPARLRILPLFPSGIVESGRLCLVGKISFTGQASQFVLDNNPSKYCRRILGARPIQKTSFLKHGVEYLASDQVFLSAEKSPLKVIQSASQNSDNAENLVRVLGI